jgi:hypothetical protein
MSESCSYVVMFYTNFHKENDWRIHAIYKNKEEALKFADLWSCEEQEDIRVWPNKNQKVLFDKKCGKKIPDSDSDDPYADQTPNKPYDGMSWLAPRVAVVEVPSAQ